jgi:hypothetical protein
LPDPAAAAIEQAYGHWAPDSDLPKLMGEVIKFVPRRKPQPGFVHPA